MGNRLTRPHGAAAHPVHVSGAVVGLVIHVDGGSRGNPGPAGAGVVICDESGARLHEGAYFLGTQTNNSAEYQALIRGLQRAEKLAGRPIHIRSDSELLVRQLIGEYRVKNQALAALFTQVQMLLLRFGGWQIRHVPREQNQRADELANLAMDRKRDIIVFDVDLPAENGSGNGGIAQGASTAAPAGTATSPAEPAPDAPPGRTPPNGAADEHDPDTIDVRIAAASAPVAGRCPAGAWLGEPITVCSTLPAGICIHAAHALLPTILAVQNTESDELSSVPTLTLRCGKPGCGARFLVSPVRGTNGHTKG